MDEARREKPDIHIIGSTEWHATARGERVEDLGAYLDAMASLPFLRRVAEQTLAMLRLTPGQSVLEVGCGNGIFLPLLAAAVGPHGRINGIDHSPQFVAAAQERVAAAGFSERVMVREADAYRLPFADGSFDAAHCERVLMHLEDPTAALREMRRVVKPGGVVVAAEPDWYGLQIDHPDHEAMELLIARHTTAVFRQPRMGLTLNRRMREAGLVQREIVPLMHFGTRYDAVTQYGWNPNSTAAALVTEGRITSERMDALFADLERASEEESLSVFVGIFIGAGHVPAS
jgi:ubiquinone/menaquinone biosynthesis C-methylase UbiE